MSRSNHALSFSDPNRFIFPAKKRTWLKWSRLSLRSLHIRLYLNALNIVLTVGNCLTCINWWREQHFTVKRNTLLSSVMHVWLFCFWRYLTRWLIFRLSQSSMSPSLYFSSIVKSRSHPFLEPTSFKLSCSMKLLGPLVGFEPTTSTLRVRRTTHCATPPQQWFVF